MKESPSESRSRHQSGHRWVLSVGLLLAVVAACEAGSSGHTVVREPLGPLPQCPAPVCPEPICPKIEPPKAVAVKDAVPAGPVELNTATVEELDALPGVGRATAERILRHRERRPFRKPRDLMRVRGIGPSKYRDLKPLVTVRN